MVLKPDEGGTKHNDPMEWAVDSRTSDVSIFMCSSGVRGILVMFDMMTHLLCWILICWIIMCMLHFLLLCMCGIFYMPGFGGTPAGEADKIGKKKLCSSVMFISSPMYIIYVPQLAEEHKFGYVPQLAEEHKFIYVPRFWAEECKVGYVPRFWRRNVRSDMFLGFGPRNVSLHMFLGWPRNITSYVPWFHVAKEHNLCSSAPMSMQSYVHQDIFLSYVPRLAEEHKLCSSAINICSSVFGRGTFVYFL
jgi:hypothetical protein